MMRKSLLLAVVGIVVIAAVHDALFVPGLADRKAEFAGHCLAAAFTVPQCDILFAQAEDNRDTANAASIASGLAMGMAIGRTK